MSDPSLLRLRSVQVNTPQGVAGLLSKESVFVFNYDRSAPAAAAVSLTMQVRQRSYNSGDLHHVFAQNRPEGYLRLIIEERLARLGAPSDLFLLYTAGSRQIGRLTYSVPGHPVPEDSAENLKEILSGDSAAIFERLIDQYALSSGISGIQPKVLVPVAGGLDRAAWPLPTVIVKTEGADFPDLARNEFFCMSVAKAAGLVVPQFFLSDDAKLFALERFDRTRYGQVIGFEDMAVLTGRSAAKKYNGSYEMVARAVATYTGGVYVEMQRLFQRVAISCLLRDGDAHLKNFGMLYMSPLDVPTLAPVYDVVCTDIYPDLDGRLALNLDGQKRFPLPNELIEFARRIGVDETFAASTVETIQVSISKVLDDLSSDPRFADGLLDRLNEAIHRDGTAATRRPAVR